jgi:hypothetical protein
MIPIPIAEKIVKGMVISTLSKRRCYAETADKFCLNEVNEMILKIEVESFFH